MSRFWKTIDSAPQDGTKIEAARIHTEGEEIHRNTYYDNGWCYNKFGEKQKYCWAPTHWREKQ